MTTLGDFHDQRRILHMMTKCPGEIFGFSESALKMRKKPKKNGWKMSKKKTTFTMPRQAGAYILLVEITFL